LELKRREHVEVREFDTSFTDDQLDEAFRGVDVIVSALTVGQLGDQKKLVDSAKRVGVKRFVPSDWATACPPGVMELQDIVSVAFKRTAYIAHFLNRFFSSSLETRYTPPLERSRLGLYVHQRWAQVRRIRCNDHRHEMVETYSA